jgi:hypothetical protein
MLAHSERSDDLVLFSPQEPARGAAAEASAPLVRGVPPVVASGGPAFPNAAGGKGPSASPPRVSTLRSPSAATRHPSTPVRLPAAPPGFRPRGFALRRAVVLVGLSLVVISLEVWAYRHFSEPLPAPSQTLSGGAAAPTASAAPAAVAAPIASVPAASVPAASELPTASAPAASAPAASAAPQRAATPMLVMTLGNRELPRTLASSETRTPDRGANLKRPVESGARPQHAASRVVAPRQQLVRRPEVPASSAISLPKTADADTAAAPVPAAGFRGALFIESLPEGARVFVDRELFGFTPLVVPGLLAGTRIVRVEATAHEPWSATVRVVADEQTPVTAHLRPASNR